MATVYLQPSTSRPVPVLSALSPNSNAISINPQNEAVYFAAFDVVDYDRVFLVGTYQIFAGLQSLAELDQEEQQSTQAHSRIASLLRGKLLDQLTGLESREDTALETLYRVKSVFQTFSLCQILFLQDAPVISEDLLHWVNTCDLAPSREQGLELASMSEPYNSDLFWSYLPRCILRGLFKAALTLMSSLQDHSVPFVRKGARICCQLLQTFPRSTSFQTTDDFNRSCHLYRRSVREAIRDLESEYDDDALWTTPSKKASSKKAYIKEDQRLEWLARFLAILKLLNGEQDAVMEHAEDWKEALAAWALLIRPTMATDDIPETIEQILDHEHIQIDLDDPLLAAQHALLLGHTAKAMSKCAASDLWLATHLTDLLEKAGAMEHDPEETLSFRDWFIFRYVDQLMADPGLWRVAVHYLSFTGEQGVERIRQILLRVVYTLSPAPAAVKSADMDVEGAEAQTEPEAPMETTPEDVLQACFDYGLPDLADSICRQVAEKLIRSREYGRAIAYIVQSGDTVRMASVTDALIDEYLSKGQEEFAKLVDAIPTRLLRPGTLATEADDPQSRDNYKLFADKIAFLAQYRDFHAFFAQGARLEAAKLLAGMLASGLPPKRFVAVLLLDAVPLLEDSEAHLDASETFELLRCLQEVEMAAEEVAYLAPMGALVAGAGKAHSQQELVAIARQQVKLVRLALARNLSRALIMQ